MNLVVQLKHSLRLLTAASFNLDSSTFVSSLEQYGQFILFPLFSRETLQVVFLLVNENTSSVFHSYYGIVNGLNSFVVWNVYVKGC